MRLFSKKLRKDILFCNRIKAKASYLHRLEAFNHSYHNLGALAGAHDFLDAKISVSPDSH